ncbi:pre-rRNA-processing protein ESF2-like, partial [Prosopis cineraria]|uniref:pre-rRNA-processing protein ESF2-like n=1 Tax=Prosopis cineraria TaxID=364024 RepID=UPI00240EB927
MKKRKSKEASSSETLGEHLQADDETLQREASPIYGEEEEVAVSPQIKRKRKKKLLEGNSGLRWRKRRLMLRRKPVHIPMMRKRVPKKKIKKRLLKEAEKADKRGVCYLSRIPPHMDHLKLRRILSPYGDIQRIYLAPE